MINILQNKHLLRIALGVVIGGLLGFLYYRLVGCSTGACPITRNPVSSIIYGSLIGFLFTMRA